uniref:outer membrane protein transport protein n=1 Tax=Thaumasiovibrio occultus TaxID=1891184 RepID=UPI000B359C9F|nr:outer membrane protein transport protein [Thaumasiovibrio occultus]
MQNKFLPKRHLIGASILAALTTQAHAAGLQLNSQSATGLGRAFSGDAVIGDNASVMARNPGAMTLFDTTSLSFGGIYLDTDIVVKDTTYGGKSIPDEQIGGSSIAPNFYLIVPINEQWVTGVSVYSNFATRTEFSDSYAASEMGGITDVKSINLGLSAAYRFNDQWSAGAGVDVIFGQGRLLREKTIGSFTQTLLDADIEGTAYGYNLGVMYEHNADNRFGLSYRNSPTLEASGRVDYISGLGTTKDHGALDMPLPDMIEFSGFHQLNPKWAVHYSVQWIEWKVFDQLNTTSGVELENYEWQNGWHYALGATYSLSSQWTLRAGYMHDTSAQDEITSISVPDSSRNWLSAGASYHMSSHSTIDFGFTYLMGEDVAVKDRAAIFPELTATTRANAILVGLQYSYEF